MRKQKEKKATKTKICGTKLYVKCQMNFGLTYKHHCVIHNHRAKGLQHILIADNTYLTHIKKFLNDSTKSPKTTPNFGMILIMFLNITSIADILHDAKEEQSKEYMECCENLCVRANNKTSLNFMTTHAMNMIFFNITKDLWLHENWQGLQYLKQQHSHYLDSNWGSVKSLQTNIFFGLKDVAGSGHYGFLCLMVAINSDENVSRWFDNAVQEFNDKLGNKVKKTQSALPITQLIGKFKKLLFQFHITSLKNYCEKGEEYATEVGNICDDYIATLDTLYQNIIHWEKLGQSHWTSKQIKKKPETRKTSKCSLKNLRQIGAPTLVRLWFKTWN